MTEEQQKLKYVFIPPYDKPSKICLQESEMPEKLLNRPCEGCCTYESESLAWYPWGPEKYNCRLCAKCWQYWKKYGGLQLPQTTRKNILSSRGDGKVIRSTIQCKVGRNYNFISKLKILKKKYMSLLKAKNSVKTVSLYI